MLVNGRCDGSFRDVLKHRHHLSGFTRPFHGGQVRHAIAPLKNQLGGGCAGNDSEKVVSSATEFPAAP